MNITSSEIRKKYLEFFKSKNHAIIESAPLVPENDPSVLFNTAWMQPLVPYLLWEKHPMWTRIADVQKCVRTNDIDEVGDNTHFTFFEMLGNWSLGDYFKKESIEMSYELLTSPKWFWINPDYLAVTVFEWDANAPRDEYSADIWKTLGIPESRISYMWADDNWWAAGPTWPCWPDTEIFYWVWEWEPRWNVKDNDSEWMEIWNNVFMEFNKLPDWTLVNLPAQNVDTGMWLERITRTLNRKESCYNTDIFSDIMTRIKEIVGESSYIERSARIIADHLRAATHMIADWVIPKNVDQWYILRRLIRRAIREFYKMWYEKPVIWEFGKIYINKFRDIYQSIARNEKVIIDELNKEEIKFGKTIKQGLKELWKFALKKQLNWGIAEIIEKDFNIGASKYDWAQLSWQEAFHIFETYWLPFELIQEELHNNYIAYWLKFPFTVNHNEFNLAFQKHQELSRTASEGKFKWGLSGDWEMETKYHTVTHIMLAGLRKILGNHVVQKWANITAERIRFDFSHPDKVTPEQLKQVEDFVNDVIKSWAVVTMKEMKKEDAINDGAVWSFWEKYPDIVKIYTITGPNWEVYSKELCWWPHIENTDNLWTFRIKKEEASSSWVRRIKAVLE